MNIKIDDVIEFNNGEYLVLDVINRNDNTYLYLINNHEFLNDISITKVINKEGKYEFTNIDDNSEFDFVMNKIFLDLSDDILELVNNE
ncbi:MAG: hypothetical protein PUA90_06075 [bacterium]|nr:hypothetical protein [bacterium]